MSYIDQERHRNILTGIQLVWAYFEFDYAQDEHGFIKLSDLKDRVEALKHMHASALSKVSDNVKQDVIKDFSKIHLSLNQDVSFKNKNKEDYADMDATGLGDGNA